MMKIIEDKENFLTNRKEVKVIVEAVKNPSYEEAFDIIVREFRADKENIVVRDIKGKFGRNTFLISAFVYKSLQDKERFERKKKEKKKQGEQQVPVQQAAQEKK